MFLSVAPPQQPEFQILFKCHYGTKRIKFEHFNAIMALFFIETLENMANQATACTIEKQANRIGE